MLKVYTKPEAEMLNVTVENMISSSNIGVEGTGTPASNERRGDWGSIWNK